MKNFERGGHARRLALVAAGIAALAVVGGVAGARINTTQSIAKGLYWTSAASLQKGAYVVFCPPARDVFEQAKRRGYIGSGFCPGHYGYMMKRVLALEGDAVAIDEVGVHVNGALLPHSTPLAADRAGRPLPRYRLKDGVLRESEVLLMSDASATSFDARYFGPIARTQIRAVIRPVITW